MNRHDSVLAAFVATIWGFNFVVIDWGMEGVDPLLFVALRFMAVLLPALLLIPKPDMPWRTILAVGAFMSLGQFGFLYVAMDTGMPPGLAALVLQAQVIFTVVIAAGVLRERPTARQTAGVVIGSLGLLVVGLGRGGEVPLLALALCLLGALSWGVGNVVSRASGATGGLALTVWSALIVPVPLVGLSLLLDGPSALVDSVGAFGWEAGVSTIYTAGLSSIVGYGIFNTLLSRNPPAAVVPWVLLAPVVAMVSAWLLLAQRPNPAEAAGGLVMILGVLVALRTRRSGEVGGALLHLGHKAERGPADLALLRDDPLPGRGLVDAAVEDQHTSANGTFRTGAPLKDVLLPQRFSPRVEARAAGRVQAPTPSTLAGRTGQRAPQ